MSSDIAASPLLSVKQSIPPPRAGVVPRARLEDRLTATTKLTVVVAPAGSGKTSLLSRWASAVAPHTPVAWVSLDESDDEPVRFWSYVLASLARVSSDISPAAIEALPASREGPMAQALPLLLNELAESSTRHLLVLDDVHAITHPEIHESLEFLLAYLPPALNVVLASRVDPPLPLARMRVRGEVAELRAEDLRFSLDEALALLAAVSATDPDPAVTESVWRQTEGWAAGLQLAGLALRASAGRPQARVGADDRHLFDYFTNEVFPALSDPQRDLLVRTASLELLSGSLCDAALGDGASGSAEVLESLERADLFVVALDPQREWFRCHRLLRDALRRLPASRDDEAERDVLRRASRWFEEHDRIDDAVRHRLAAGDHREAATLLQSQREWFLERGWGADYVALGERLPEDAVHPRLALSLAFAAEISGHHDRVPRLLDLLDRRIDADSVIDNWRSAPAAALMMRGLIGTPASESAASVAFCERALALEAEAGTDQHPIALLALGSAYGLDGRFEEGARILSDSWRLRGRGLWSRATDLQVAGLLSLFLLSLDREEQLDRLLAEAQPLVDVAVRDWGDTAAHVATLVRFVQGRRAYQQGDLAAARLAIDGALPMADIAARPLFSVVGLVFLADLELATGNRRAAEAALVRARDVADNEPLSPVARRLLEQAETRIGRVAVRAAAETGTLLEELTDREMSILRMLPGTATQREIGAALFVSINTVKAYNKSLYRKLGVGGRQDAVRAARRLGLI
jgi:LuxR family maltose regulon positive regulatory protein